MLKILRTFIFINLWGILLDLLAASIFLLTIILKLPIYINIPLYIISAFILIKGIELHLRYREKYRARLILLARNKIAFKEYTFEKYMVAPCGRMLVKEVLLTLNMYNEYKNIRNRYYKGFFSSSEKESLVIIPAKEEVIV